MSSKKSKGILKQKLVTNFFDRYVDDFYSIYKGQTLLSRILNNVLRRSMYKRFSIARDIILSNGVCTLLDVGCGTGIHDIQLCVNDKINVLGIDISENMISKAKELYSSEKKHDSSCKFMVSDFTTMNSDCEYDAVLSLGVLEYIEDIISCLKKMTEISNNLVIVSLPSKWHILVPQRKLRYWLRNCPLYFYSKSDLVKITNKIGANDYSIINLGRDYLLVIRS